MSRAMLVTVALTTVVLGGCSAADDGVSDGRPQGGDGASSLLLAPVDFAAYLDAEPDAALLNVHVPYEGHIPDTDDFVPFEEIDDWDGLPSDLSDPIALYCQSGRMSGIAADTLADLGYTAVVDLEGGMNAWQDSGLPLVRGVQDDESSD